MTRHLKGQGVVEVGQVFVDAFTHLQANYQESAAWPKILEHVLTYVTLGKPHVTVTEAGINAQAAQIFNDRQLSDFYMGLTFLFFSRLGDEEEVEGLINNIARGASVVSTPTVISGANGALAQINLMPKEYQTRLIDAGEVAKRLSSNNWLVTLICCQMFLRIGTEIKQGRDK